jgi:hypothetical protein
MVTPHYKPEPHVLGWLRAFTLPSDTILDVGSGDRRYQDVGASDVKSLDIWPAAEPDYLLDLEKEDLPDEMFSVIFLIDVLEHISEQRGREILRQAQERAKRAIVALTPLKWNKNEEPYQKEGGFYQNNKSVLHRSLWSLTDFDRNWTRVWLPSTKELFFGYWVRPMTDFGVSNFNIDSGSHLPVLMKLMEISEGPVLELGTGFYSTPFLHWACFSQGRKLVSYDSAPLYFELANNCSRDFHEVYFVKDWDKIDISQHWGVVLVDHEPTSRRLADIERLANNADYIILHDSEKEWDLAYQYSKIYSLFKYRYDYTKRLPHTTVVSNFKDLSELKECFG